MLAKALAGLGEGETGTRDTQIVASNYTVHSEEAACISHDHHYRHYDARSESTYLVAFDSRVCRHTVLYIWYDMQ